MKIFRRAPKKNPDEINCHGTAIIKTKRKKVRKKLVAFVAVFALFTEVVIAQSKDEKKIAAAVEIYRKGMVDADRAALEMITANELVYGHSNGKVQTKAEFVDEIISNNPLDYVTVDITEQTIKLAGNTAIVRHTFSAETKGTDGKPGKVFIGNTLVFQKQQGKWKLLARQAYRK
jgi:ketosteroid isomerase-like protein